MEGVKTMSIQKKYHTLSDSEWLSLLKKSIYNNQDQAFPPFIDKHLQEQFGGSSNENTLNEANEMYIYIKNLCKKFTYDSFSIDTKILDFGIGWGRILRFFLKDIKIDNLFGCDVDPDMIKFCRQYYPNKNMLTISPQGQLPF